MAILLIYTVPFFLKCESLKGKIVTHSGEGMFCFFVVGVGGGEMGQSGEHNTLHGAGFLTNQQICWFVRLTLFYTLHG
jgi:hypothetical protein